MNATTHLTNMLLLRKWHIFSHIGVWMRYVGKHFTTVYTCECMWHSHDIKLHVCLKHRLYYELDHFGVYSEHNLLSWPLEFPQSPHQITLTVLQLYWPTCCHWESDIYMVILEYVWHMLSKVSPMCVSSCTTAWSHDWMGESRSPIPSNKSCVFCTELMSVMDIVY